MLHYDGGSTNTTLHSLRLVHPTTSSLQTPPKYIESQTSAAKSRHVVLTASLIPKSLHVALAVSFITKSFAFVLLSASSIPKYLNIDRLLGPPAGKLLQHHREHLMENKWHLDCI